MGREQLDIMADDGVRLAVTLDGAAATAPLVLAGSLGTTAEMWTRQVETLAARFRLIRFDLRGHGRSEIGPRPYTIERLARDVLAILDALALRRAHVAGVSLGGMLGQWLGAHAPDRVDGLVLANTAAYMGPATSWDARIETVTSAGMSGIADVVVDRWFTPRFRTREPATVAELRAMVLATPPAGYTAACVAIRDMDQRGTVSAITAPTLIIAGDADVATPVSASAELAAAIAGSTMITLDAAHLSNIEQADLFNQAVIEHLS